MTVETTVMILALILCAIMLGLVYEWGKKQGHRDYLYDVNCADRYRMAIDLLDKWCGHEFPQARLIAAHLKAEGEGLSMNAGTPHSDEPCTISGLREQLRRRKNLDYATSERQRNGYSRSPAPLDSARTQSNATASGTAKHDDSSDLLNPLNPLGLNSSMWHSTTPTHSDCGSHQNNHDSSSYFSSSSSDCSSSSDSSSCSSCD